MDEEDLAELWGVDVDDVEDLLEAAGLDLETVDAYLDVPLDDDDRPDPDYMLDLADSLDLDVSDLYDMYYGYAPGSSEA